MILRTIFLVCVNIIFIISTSACQTIQGSDDRGEKEADIRNDQKALVVSLLNKGQAQMAHSELRSLLFKYPEDPDLLNLMGLSYLALAQPEQSIIWFQKSLREENRVSVALNLSSALIESTKYDTAISYLLKLKKDPRARSYRYPERIDHNIALAAERKNLMTQAIKYYKKALAINPQYYLSLMRLGQVYEKMEKPVMALDQFKMARSVCNLCFDPVVGLVNNYQKLGRNREAGESIKLYLSQKQVTPENKTRAMSLVKDMKR